MFTVQKKKELTVEKNITCYYYHYYIYIHKGESYPLSAEFFEPKTRQLINGTKILGIFTEAVLDLILHWLKSFHLFYTYIYFLLFYLLLIHLF